MAHPTTDHYSCLGVSPTATTTEITAKYRKLAFATHPDHVGNESRKEDFLRYTAAYEVLNNPVSRRQYDASLLYNRTATVSTGPRTYSQPQHHMSDAEQAYRRAYAEAAHEWYNFIKEQPRVTIRVTRFYQKWETIFGVAILALIVLIYRSGSFTYGSGLEFMFSKASNPHADSMVPFTYMMAGMIVGIVFIIVSMVHIHIKYRRYRRHYRIMHYLRDSAFNAGAIIMILGAFAGLTYGHYYA